MMGLKRAVVCLPETSALRHLLVQAGITVISEPPLTGHPFSMWVRDTAFCTPVGFVWLRMGTAAREAESDWMGEILRREKVLRIGVIQVPGRVEGGDVLLAGDIAFVGRSARTNAEGAAQIRHILEHLGYAVRETYVPAPYLHLNDALGVISPHRLLACTEVFPEELFHGFDVIMVAPAPGQLAAANLLALNENEVVVELSNRTAVEALRDAEIRVHAVALPELGMSPGGPGSLVLPVV